MGKVGFWWPSLISYHVATKNATIANFIYCGKLECQFGFCFLILEVKDENYKGNFTVDSYIFLIFLYYISIIISVTLYV